MLYAYDFATMKLFFEMRIGSRLNSAISKPTSLTYIDISTISKSISLAYNSDICNKQTGQPPRKKRPGVTLALVLLEFESFGSDSPFDNFSNLAFDVTR